MKCPICGRGEVVRVGPWDSGRGDFGLGFQMASGRTCCSLHDRFRGTEQQAQEYADSKTLQEWAVDEDCSWQKDEEDLIGDQWGGDPYDREPLQF